MKAGRVIAIATLAGLAGTAPTASGTTLISDAEAARAPVSEHSRGITRGPGIELAAPQDTVTAPFVLHVRFVPHGGAKVDPNSVHVVLLREPLADLTARLRPFVTKDGIELRDAEAPEGAYDLRIDVRDDGGREGLAVVRVSVAR